MNHHEFVITNNTIVMNNNFEVSVKDLHKILRYRKEIERIK